MTEQMFWRKQVRPNLIHFGILRRIENAVEAGTPDVTYCLRRKPTDNQAVSGWCELKHCAHWPVRVGSNLRFKRFTVGQADWLYDWDRMGGKACVLCKVGRDYFLMAGRYARELRAGMTRDQIVATAAVTGFGVFPTGRIIRWLTER